MVGCSTGTGCTVYGRMAAWVCGSDGYRLLPSASDIGFFARYADASAIGSCAPSPSVFVVGGKYTYVCREHVDVVTSRGCLHVRCSQVAGSSSRLHLQLELV